MIQLQPEKQSYLSVGGVGEKADMNRANEVRPIFRSFAEGAECTVILIGHLNKTAGGQSAYRGLGSIDFRAAVPHQDRTGERLIRDLLADGKRLPVRKS